MEGILPTKVNPDIDFTDEAVIQCVASVAKMWKKTFVDYWIVNRW